MVKENMLKEFTRGLGLNPQEVQYRKTILEPETKYLRPQEREQWQIRVVMGTIREELTRQPGETTMGTLRVAGPEDSNVLRGKILTDFPFSSAERSLSDYFLELSSN